MFERRYMWLPFSNGLIRGIIIGISVLAVLSLSNEILGSKVSGAGLFVIYPHKTPNISAGTVVLKSKIQSRPSIRFPGKLDAKIIQFRNLELWVGQSTQKKLKSTDCLAKPCVYTGDHSLQLR